MNSYLNCFLNFQIGQDTGIMLNKELTKALKEEEKLGEKRERYGFLR